MYVPLPPTNDINLQFTDLQFTIYLQFYLFTILGIWNLKPETYGLI